MVTIEAPPSLTLAGLAEELADLQDRVVSLEEAARLRRQNRLASKRVRAAASWLASVLHDGPVYAAALRQAAKDGNMSFQTLSDAATVLKVVQKKDGFGGKWIWSLPDSDGGTA